MRNIRDRKSVTLFDNGVPVDEGQGPFLRPLPDEARGEPMITTHDSDGKPHERGERFSEMLGGRTPEQAEETQAEISRQRRCRVRAVNAVSAWQSSGDAIVGLEDTSAAAFKETLIGLALTHTDADSPVWDQLIESFVIHAVDAGRRVELERASLDVADEGQSAPPQASAAAVNADLGVSLDAADEGRPAPDKHLPDTEWP